MGSIIDMEVAFLRGKMWEFVTGEKERSRCIIREKEVDCAELVGCKRQRRGESREERLQRATFGSSDFVVEVPMVLPRLMKKRCGCKALGNSRQTVMLVSPAAGETSR